MDKMIRIERIEINGIKNVCHGIIPFNECNDVMKGDFDNLKSVLGIYGQNGSGKTTLLEVTRLLKDLLIGRKLPSHFHHIMSNECEKAEISYTFFVKSYSSKQLITYTFRIGLIDECYEIYYEKITSKEYSNTQKKWKPQITLIECQNKEIVLKKLMNKISKESLIELRVAQDIEKGTSFIFNARNRNILLKEIKNESLSHDDSKLVEIIELLPSYAHTNLIIIENDMMGSINLNTYDSIHFNLSSYDALMGGVAVVNLLEAIEMPINIYQIIEKVIEQIDIVFNAIIPSIHLKIVNQKQQLLSDGKEGIRFEVVSVRNHKFIPLKYESEGIKRLISVISSMIAAFNNESICLMIDEFDSSIFEYLLGELVEIIDESAKGQFIFTSHNLRALEKLSYKSIIITTVNPNNRYIQMTGVKPNNNIRDYYYTNIILGGQNEPIYEETQNYKIKRAFRKAGKQKDD